MLPNVSFLICSTHVIHSSTLAWSMAISHRWIIVWNQNFFMWSLHSQMFQYLLAYSSNEYTVYHQLNIISKLCELINVPFRYSDPIVLHVYLHVICPVFCVPLMTAYTHILCKSSKTKPTTTNTYCSKI